MSYITTCPRCGHCYQESSSEEADNPDRRCHTCWSEMVHEPEDDGIEWNSDPHNRRVNS